MVSGRRVCVFLREGGAMVSVLEGGGEWDEAGVVVSARGGGGEWPRGGGV
jgi:hypothetical protein